MLNVLHAEAQGPLSCFCFILHAEAAGAAELLFIFLFHAEAQGPLSIFFARRGAEGAEKLAHLSYRFPFFNSFTAKSAALAVSAM